MKKEILKEDIWKSNVDIGLPCLTPVFTPKLDSLFPTLHVKIVVEAPDDKDDLLWNSTFPEFAPQTLSVDAVESLSKSTIASAIQCIIR